MSPAPVRVVQYGLGPIGLACARLLLDKAAATGLVELVGAIDIDPAKSGRTVGELTGQACDVIVGSRAEEVLKDSAPDVVLHTTGSFLDQVADQLTACIEAGACVVSSTEELLFPFERHPALAQTIDRTAKHHRVAVLGTGVNPGYAMDTLALMATGVCTEVRKIHAFRLLDAAHRREPLQRKVGAGLSEAEFLALRDAGKLGHIGLVESLRLVMHGLGWPIDELTEKLEPVLAESEVRTPYLKVEPGRVAGIRHTASASRNGQTVVSLDLRMYVGAPRSEDRVTVDGDPPVDMVVDGGIFGDTATVAALFNAIPLIRAARPGLQTMADLPVLRAFSCPA